MTPASPCLLASHNPLIHTFLHCYHTSNTASYEQLEQPDVAIEIFEDSFGFVYDPDPARDLVGLLGQEERVEQGLGSGPAPPGKAGKAGGDVAGDEVAWVKSKDAEDILAGAGAGTTAMDVLALLQEQPMAGAGAASGRQGAVGAGDITVSPPQSASAGAATAAGAVASLRPHHDGQGSEISLSFLEPNNFVCTTAVKAYGRKGTPPCYLPLCISSPFSHSTFTTRCVCVLTCRATGQVDKALYILPWLEARRPTEPADVYLLTALIFVCAKTKRVPEVNQPRPSPLFDLPLLLPTTIFNARARMYPTGLPTLAPVLTPQAERLVWRDMPARNLSYSVATTNSLMYMYAKLNRPDDALKVQKTL